MRIGWKMAAVAAFSVLCLGGASYAAAHTSRTAAPPPGKGNPHKNPDTCQLGQAAGANNNIKHVIYLQFDNTHFNRDNPNVESDLEQMPHLYNFLKDNGTLFTNDHTILISHTAGGILSSLTGLYPDRQGQTVSNSYDYLPGGRGRAVLRPVLVQVLDGRRRHGSGPEAEHDHRRRPEHPGAVGAVHAGRL